MNPLARGARILVLAATLAVLPIAFAGQDVTPAARYADAEALIRNHRWDEGIAVLQPLLHETSTSPKALNLMGLAFAGKREPGQAEKFFAAALKAAPDFTPALKNLAIEEVSQGETEAAERHLQAAFALSPDDQVVNLYLGEILYRQKKFSAAAKHLSRARELASHDPNVMARLAISELQSGQQQDSLSIASSLQPATLDPSMALVLGDELAKSAHCDRAIPYLLIARDGSPASADLGYNLAVCYLQTRQFSESAATLHALIDQGLESSEIDNTLAEVYEADHQTQKAVDAFRRAIALSPEDDDNYFDFASLCLDHQDFKNADKVLSVGLGVHPKSSRLIFERGILNAMQDRFEEAEKDFQLSADLAPESDTGYIGLGVTYLETGKAAQAIPVLRKRVSEHPDDANLNYLLAEALVRSGAQNGDPAYAEAESRLERSTKLAPKMVEPHVSLGTIYLRQNKVAEAVEQLEMAHAIDPKSKSACAHLAVAYRRLGDSEKARKTLLALKELNDNERGGTRDAVRSVDTDVKGKKDAAS